MMTWLSQLIEALRAALFRRREDAELAEELRFHIDMEAQRLVAAEGLGAAEARRRAAVAFGGVDRHAEAVRDARGLAWLTGMSLDFKLAARMLARSWGLTLIGGLAIALAIMVGAVFHAASRLVHTPLPLDGGAAIVALEYWDSDVNNQERRILHDFAIWRGALQSVRDVSAYRTTGRNLVAADGSVEPIPLAEMTASGFRVARVPALLGRTLLDADEHEGAPPVAVLGYELWRTRFGADPRIVGSDIRLGDAVHTVVGVMPEGFAFPLNHRLWIPLGPHVAEQAPRSGPGVFVFGRLAPGASLATARAELATLSARAAAAYPETHTRLRATAVPYTAQLFDDMQGWEIPVVHVMLFLLLAVVCANIAILVYARSVARTGEIAVRSALGASRRRIVGQLYIEALVLAGVAAVVGLLAAQAAVTHINALLQGWGGPDGAGGLPFWIALRITPATVLYVAILAALSAAIMGVLPALKVAGGHVQNTLRQLSGGTGPQLGRTWNALIVVQVAVAVAFLPAAVSAGWKTMQHAAAHPGFAADEFHGAAIALARAADEHDDAYRGRYAEHRAELVQRALAGAAVRAAAWTVDLPGHEPTVRVASADTRAEGDDVSFAARFARVDPGFFEMFDVAPFAGRALHATDADTRAVVVNRSFAAQLHDGTGVVGRTVRYTSGYRAGGAMRTPPGVDMETWYEIVGVVPDFPQPIDPDEVTARIYHAAASDDPAAAMLIIHAPGAASDAVAAALRRDGAGIDPLLQVRTVRSLDAVMRDEQAGMRLAAIVIGVLTLSVLLLSAAGIFALMAFTVARRRREIGIRAALGAEPAQLLRSIFARALRQIAAGVIAGLAVAALLEVASGGALMDGRSAVLLPVVAALMMLAGMLAAIEPMRRGLRIQPTEALREE